ncbi:MAG: hypothetical protein ACREX4_14990 [Gammaproteobacteria bacterium]
MPADQLQAFLLLSAPFRSLPIEEVGIDAAVEFVDVHRIDAVLKTPVLGLNSADGRLVMLLLVVVAHP